MPTLSSLLLQREVTTLREIDVALARQLAHGGDLVTNLQEIAPIDEAALVPVMAEAAGLTPLRPGRLPEPDSEALALVPVDLAQRLGVVPLSVNEDSLVLAVAEPLAASAEEELTFALARAIEQRITTAVRIREAQALWYGVTFSRRYLRLLARIEGRPDPSPSSLPPRRVPGDSVLPPRLPGVASEPSGPVAIAPIIAVDKNTRADAIALAREALVNPPPLPLPAPLPASSLVGQPVAAPPPAKPRQQGPKRKVGIGRRRGPFTAAMAQEALSEAETHGVMLRVLFDFARQYFEYTALFVLHGDLAEGVDAAGPGADASRIRGIGVPIEIPSILSTAKDRRSALLARPAEDGIDAFLRQDLDRPMTTQVLVVPVVVRNRVVALLYGDDGEVPVAMNEVGDVLSLSSLVGKALERLLLQRKRARETPSQPPRVEKPRAHYESARPETRQVPRAQRAPESSAPQTQRDPISAPHRSLSSPFPMAAPFPEREATTLPGLQTGPRHITANYLPTVTGIPGQESVTNRRTQQAALSEESAAENLPSRPPQRKITRPLPIPTALQSGIETVRVARVIPVGAEPQPSPEPPAAKPPVSPSPQPVAMASRIATTPPNRSPLAASVPPRLELAEQPSPRLELVEQPEEPVEDDESPDVLVEETEDADEMLETVLAELERSSPEVGTVAGDEVLLRETAVARTFVEEGPRQPPKSQPPGDRNLPLVIVDLEGEAEQLLARLVGARDGREASEARAELLRMGAAAARTVAKSFPGPVFQSIELDLPEMPAASECGPVLDVAVALGQATLLGRAMVHELLKLTESSEPSTRVWALLALADIGTERAVDAVLQALLDDDPRVRRGARWAAIAISGEHVAGTAMREALEQLAESSVLPEESRKHAIATIGELRDPCSVPLLIRLLAEADKEVAEAAFRALRVVTRKDLPANAKKWTVWWNENQTVPRIEWLIEALTSPTTELREGAAKELAQRTGRDFGYRADMPLEARASVQARYRALRAQERREPRE